MQQEYFEGTRTIVHDDGSSTHITYEHEPYVEPLSPKQTVALGGVALGICALVVGFPVVQEWRENRRIRRNLKPPSEAPKQDIPKNDD
jgi:hypothetical protein